MFETNNHTCDATFCTFDAVVGGVLALMCLVGFILNTLVLWILLVVKVNVPGKYTFCKTTHWPIVSFRRLNL